MINNDFIGMSFGRLTVISRNGRLQGYPAYKCNCACGNETTVRLSSLLSSNTTSCGCRRREVARLLAQTLTGRRRQMPRGPNTYGLKPVWNTMIRSCYDDGFMGYSMLGCMGIKVCKQWRNDFVTFRNWARVNGWQKDKGLLLERVDERGNFTPDNCYFESLAKLWGVDIGTYNHDYDGLCY